MMFLHSLSHTISIYQVNSVTRRVIRTEYALFCRNVQILCNGMVRIRRIRRWSIIWLVRSAIVEREAFVEIHWFVAIALCLRIYRSLNRQRFQSHKRHQLNHGELHRQRRPPHRQQRPRRLLAIKRNAASIQKETMASAVPFANVRTFCSNLSLVKMTPVTLDTFANRMPRAIMCSQMFVAQKKRQWQKRQHRDRLQSKDVCWRQRKAVADRILHWHVSLVDNQLR